RKVVKEWREEILCDLAALRIELNNAKATNKTFGFSLSDYKMVARNYEFYFSITKIVSKEFIKSPKIFDYDWFSGEKLIAIETSLEQYNKIIRNLFKYNGKAFERQVLHKFYNKYPFFLKKDIYKNQIYDKRFYISSTSKFHIPDFILESPFPDHTYTSISEIKKHNIYFEFKPNQHKNFTNYTQNALNQASNYEDDFRNAGLFNGKIQMDLIIGLDDRFTEFVKRKVQKHFSTTNIVTHNKLISQVEEYYDRLKLCSI
ncbi:MAG: hypothetical protein HYZ42_09995, partial [Bacteroidetes bacterium]|nr:hypothetical protein [Bacteroidota bacterium]